MTALGKFALGAARTAGFGRRWLCCFSGCVLSIVTNRFSVASLSGIFLSASFLTVVGIGQMFVVTTGRGNIDLSIPSVMTLSAYSLCSPSAARTPISPLACLRHPALGLAVGLFNAALVVRLGIPRSSPRSRPAICWRPPRCWRTGPFTGSPSARS